MVKTIPFCKTSNTGKDGMAPIYIEYRYDRTRRTLINTGKKVAPDNWNPTKREVRKGDPEYQAMNNAIRAYKSRIDHIVDEAIFQKVAPTLNYVKEKLSEQGKVGSSNKPDLPELMDLWIASKQLEVQPGVITDYKALKKHIMGFAKNRRRSLIPEELNEIFYDDFKKYLENDVEVGSGKIGMMPSTVGKQIKNLKVFLRYATKYKHIKAVDLSEMKKPAAKGSDHVYVNEEELETILHLDLTAYPELQPIRDLFIIGCETGLRYSDLSNLKKAHIRDGLITKPVQKTGGKVVIPISTRLKTVLKRLNYNIPEAPHNVTFNKLIKKICLMAGLTQPHTYFEVRGNRKEEVSELKYQAISSHTCRRSFCTNQFKQGMPVLLIRKISGHNTEKAFLQYIRIDEEEAARQLAELWKGRGES